MKYRPFAAPAANAGTTTYEPVATGTPEYPSIDEFLDELPPIEDFLAAEPEPTAEMVAENSDWISAGWGSYDFSSLSDLANRAPSKAPRSNPAPHHQGAPARSLSSPGPSAEEVASALDGIARRIRTGELVIDNLQGMPPEAAMAAAIAALLRMRE